MYCIIHQYCDKAVDNGHCPVYFSEGVAWRNARTEVHPCVFAKLPEQKKRTAATKAINPIKKSKKG